MDVDRGARLVRHGSIEIGAPADVVWSVLTDFDRWPSWMPSVRSVDADGPFVTGTRFRWRAGSASLISEVLEAEPGQSAAWRGSTRGIEAIHTWRFESDPRGDTTLVRTEESWEGFLPRLLPGYLGKALAKALEDGLEALKRQSELHASG